MYSPEERQNQRRLKDLEAENEKLKEECLKKDRMFKELEEINNRLEEKLEGKGKIVVDGFSRMPLFFEGEINKQLVFENSVLGTKAGIIRGNGRRSDRDFEGEISRQLKINQELNVKNKILQVQNRSLREAIEKPEYGIGGKFRRWSEIIRSC
jgi:hypothetical protein